MYAALNPGATIRNTEVARHVNIGLIAAEAAGAETEVKYDPGVILARKSGTRHWRWLKKTQELRS